MRRIGLAVVFALCLLAASLVTEAQQAGKVYVVGILSIGFRDPGQPDWWKSFIDAMRELSYIEGRNLILKRAAANGRPDRLSGLANDLVRSRVDVIVTSSGRETQAAMRATSTIPIVMVFAPDPVGERLVTSLARPGGNVTGLTNLVPGVRQKYVELLREAVPSASRFGVIATPASLRPDVMSELEDAARVLGVTLSSLPVHAPDEFETALTQARTAGVAGVIVPGDPLTFRYRQEIVRLMLRYRLPAIYWTREYVDDGGLMAYSTNLVNSQRRVAVFVDKILKGAKPADLPVEQPTEFELVINRKTAKAIGLSIPQTLLVRADQVIQ